MALTFIISLLGGMLLLLLVHSFIGLSAIGIALLFLGVKEKSHINFKGLKIYGQSGLILIIAGPVLEQLFGKIV